MKNKVFFTGILSSLLVFMLILAACPADAGGNDDPGDSAVTIAAIAGVTAPASGGTAAMAVTEGAQFTGTVSWTPQPAGGTFAANTVYTAVITLTAKTGYTFKGVTANFFTVPGAITTNAANSGTVTAVFPSTAAPAVNFTPAVNDATVNDVTTLGIVGTAVASGTPAVATAEITGGKIKITSVSAGSATITVSDAANHNAAIQVSVAASGSIAIGAITKYQSTNPLAGAWRQGQANDIKKLVLFTDAIAYYAYSLTKQTTNIDKTNEFIYLAVPGVNGGASKSYSYELNANKQLVIKDSYLTNNQGESLDFAFTRIEESAKTGVEDVWYSKGRTPDDPFNTLLIIRTDGTVYASFDMTGNTWDFKNDGQWVRASYELIGVNATGGTIRWTDGSNASYNYTLDGNELTVLDMSAASYTKQNL
jgi:hypothetical protein